MARNRNQRRREENREVRRLPRENGGRSLIWWLLFAVSILIIVLSRLQILSDTKTSDSSDKPLDKPTNLSVGPYHAIVEQHQLVKSLTTKQPDSKKTIRAHDSLIQLYRDHGLFHARLFIENAAVHFRTGNITQADERLVRTAERLANNTKSCVVTSAKKCRREKHHTELHMVILHNRAVIAMEQSKMLDVEDYLAHYAAAQSWIDDKSVKCTHGYLFMLGVFQLAEQHYYDATLTFRKDIDAPQGLIEACSHYAFINPREIQDQIALVCGSNVYSRYELLKYVGDMYAFDRYYEQTQASEGKKHVRQQSAQQKTLEQASEEIKPCYAAIFKVLNSLTKEITKRRTLKNTSLLTYQFAPNRENSTNQPSTHSPLKVTGLGA